MYNRSNITKTTAPHFQFGAIILFVIGIIAITIYLRLGNLSDFFILIDKFKKVRLEKLIVVGAAITVPIVVWCLTSWTAMRNQIRQHSMNILLQTRTSASYLDHSTVAGKVLKGTVEMGQDEQVKESVIYILNFLEFVAIGIKRCDLDEDIFKDAWKGIVCSTVEFHKNGVISEAQAKNYKIFETLLWLNRRWQSSPRWYDIPVVSCIKAVLAIFSASFLILLFLKIIAIFLL